MRPAAGGYCRHQDPTRLVDEADSILIDEARTPLIISKPGDPPRDKYGVAVQVANFLRRDVHYSVDEKAQVRTKLPMY